MAGEKRSKREEEQKRRDVGTGGEWWRQQEKGPAPGVTREPMAVAPGRGPAPAAGVGPPPSPFAALARVQPTVAPAPAIPGMPTPGGRPWVGAPTPWSQAGVVMPTAEAAVPGVMPGAPAWLRGAERVAGAPLRTLGRAGEMLERAGRGGVLAGALGGLGQVGRVVGEAAGAATTERVAGEIARAWEPVEGGPGAFRAALGRLGAAVPGAVEMARAPVALEEMTPQQQAMAAEQRAALGALPGAAWESAKGIPWVGRVFREAEALGRAGMAGIQAPAWAVEEQIAKGIVQRAPGEYGLWPLQPAARMTEEQRAAAAAAAEETGRPLWLVQQVALAEERRGAASVRDYGTERYGAGPELERNLSRLAVGLGYSSYEAQIAGLDRLMAGEVLDTVISGRQVNVRDPSEEDLEAFGAYIGGIRQRDGEDAANAAAQQVKETGMIPGESDMWNEMLFQIALDPLNLLDIGAWSKGIQARRAAGRFAEVAASHADEVADGAKLVLAHADDAAQAVGRTGDQAGFLRRMFDRVNPFAPTARAQAETLAGTAYQVATPAVLRIEDADEAKAMVRALAEDPGRVTGALGNVPLSRAADEARPLLAAVVDKLDDAKQFPSLSAGRPFDRMAFLDDLDVAVMDAALETTGAAAEMEKAATGYQQFVNGFRSTMSEFYLRTPGYAIRNAAGDLVTMAWDGVLSFDSRGQIDDFLERFGPTTRRISRRAAAGAQTLAGEESRLPGILKGISGKAGEVIRGQEEARYSRAYVTSLKQSLKRVWTPTLPDELRALLDPEAAQALERGLAGGVNADEFAEAVGRLETGEWRLGDVAQYLDDPDDLSVGLRLELERKLAGVTDPGEIDGVIDEAVSAVQDRASAAFGADPTPPGRQVWSDMEAVQDLREEQGWVEGMGAAMGVGEDEAAQAAQQLADALRPGEMRIREAEGQLVAAAAGGMDEDTANLLRTVRSETGRAKMETRGAADRLRAEAWRQARELRDAGRDVGPVWRQYFGEVGQLYADNQAAVVARMEDGMGQLGRLRAGETFEAVVGRGVATVVEDNLAQLRALAGDVAARKERLRRLGLEDFVDFDRMLDAQRLTVDTAEAETWRLLAMNPGRDGLDIVTSTQANVDRLARAAAAESAEVREMLLGGKINKEKYTELTNAIWGQYFRDGSQGWDLARWELAQLPLTEGAQMRGLQALGWPAEEAAKLTPQEVQAVLGTGVQWDAMLNAPAMPLEEALRGTLMEVAGSAGLELTRSADWTAEEWQQVAAAAGRLRNEAGSRASAAGRLTAAAVEEVAEAAAVAPRTVAAGMEIAWPASVDDVARSLGLRPQTATADDWAQVVAYAGERAGDVDPGVASRWQDMIDQAGVRAQGGWAGGVTAPGAYDAAGLPVSRETLRRPGMQQRAVIEAAEEMVPEAERLGRGRAMVGFEQRQAWLADRYGDLEDMARARAGLLQEGRRLGEAVDVPAGVVKATTRKEGGIYLLDLADEEKRVLRTYAYDNYRDVRRARDEARKIIEAGQQGQQAAVGTAWSAWGTDDVMRADRRAAAAGGYAGAPTMADAAAAVEQTELSALERVRDGVKGAWGAEVGELAPGTRQRLMKWVNEDVARDWSQARTVSVEMARQAADFALLDYSGGRKRFDNWLGMVFPYTYWKTRSGRNWLLRVAERPGALAAYGRYRDALERQSQEKGYRERFAGTVEVPVPGMPEWTGQALFFDPTSLLMPWSQIMGPDWVGDPADAENTVEMLQRMTQRLGMRPYGFIEWPLQYFGWTGQKEEMGYVLPHTGALQAATAAAGIGPPGGVSLEAPLRRGLGMPEQEPYQAYRVNRMLANMSADDPSLTERSLRAQELQRLVEAGELRLNEAMGWRTGVTPAVARITRDQGWTEEELGEAQELLQEAVRRAGLERGLQAGTSFGMGAGLRMYPAGERRQVELEREERGALYAPLTETGTREELLAFREAHPETVPRRVARAALPGAGEYEGWTPGEALSSLTYQSRKEEINRTYDAAVDAQLAEEPWNRGAVRDLEEQRQAELEVLRDELGIGVAEEPGYRPRSVYGAAPEEERGIRREEVLAAVSAAMPKVAEFADEEGNPDYEAYNAAVAGFFENLPARMAGDERLAGVMEAMGEAVPAAVPERAVGIRPKGVAAPAEAGVEGLLAGIDREVVEAYWRRNDRPLEAAQRVWEDVIYGEAWERYNQAVDAGMDKGDAYEEFIEGGEVRAEELIRDIQEAYPDRWTEEELREVLAGVTFPGVGEASLLRKPPEEQELARAQGAFWDFLNEELPPGQTAKGAKEHTLVQLVLDAETRGTATAEQYQRALEKLQDWKAEHFDAEKWGTPEEWAEARELNEDLNALIEEQLPGVRDLLDRYYDLSPSERRAFKKEHPEIGEYYDLREAFGADNEVWARYYLGRAARVSAGAYRAGQKYRKYYKKKYYRRGGGRGRRGAGADQWQFKRLAERVPYGPKLVTPSAWEGMLKERFKPYEYERRGVPWLLGKWRKY